MQLQLLTVVPKMDAYNEVSEKNETKFNINENSQEDV